MGVEVEGQGRGIIKGNKEILEGKVMFIILIVMLVSRLYSYVKTY